MPALDAARPDGLGADLHRHRPDQEQSGELEVEGGVLGFTVEQAAADADQATRGSGLDDHAVQEGQKREPPAHSDVEAEPGDVPDQRADGGTAFERDQQALLDVVGEDDPLEVNRPQGLVDVEGVLELALALLALVRRIVLGRDGDHRRGGGGAQHREVHSCVGALGQGYPCRLVGRRKLLEGTEAVLGDDLVDLPSVLAGQGDGDVDDLEGRQGQQAGADHGTDQRQPGRVPVGADPDQGDGGGLGFPLGVQMPEHGGAQQQHLDGFWAGALVDGGRRR
ncbi:hypothetical protein J7E94_23140 [Streptomyces sp. ISL-94]|nr:hypothetical protein [Streptomyces sp. ISL-94]MBT2481057.1 hypothetical protein [Streptomyces sp. ISL-94]